MKQNDDSQVWLWWFTASIALMTVADSILSHQEFSRIALSFWAFVSIMLGAYHHVVTSSSLKKWLKRIQFLIVIAGTILFGIIL